MTVTEIKKILKAAKIDMTSLVITRDSIKVSVQVADIKQEEGFEFLGNHDEAATMILVKSIVAALNHQWYPSQKCCPGTSVLVPFRRDMDLDGYAATCHY